MDGLLGIDLPNRSLAPSTADITGLVVTGSDAAGALVSSTIDMTSIDLPAIEDLFA